MGCCNKQREGEPIARRRYYAGMVGLAGMQLGWLAVTCAVSVPVPRYRKLIPFQLEYSRDVLRSIWRRERMCVRGLGGEPGSSCSWEPEAS
jgi:hypothetical protein